VELDDEVCLCFHVSKRKILNFLRVEKPRHVSQISECFGAGTGCGWCRPFLKRYYEQVLHGAVASDAISPQEYARQRGQYVREGKGTPPPGATPVPEE
jgi:NAD(P)H-nitrite reductase large subunit